METTKEINAPKKGWVTEIASEVGCTTATVNKAIHHGATGRKAELCRQWFIEKYVKQAADPCNDVQVAQPLFVRSARYKNWLIEWNERWGYYDVFTPEEAEMPDFLRVAEINVATIDEVKEYINSH